ncbi:MAG: Holliday junction branch migration protein RuvA [Epsilonproteobacteria bacterium]|nr:Holliday junction branch migration protein RuvA [Campylobacterota bacterium]NPA64767.1 Holliday junction branch migration protein RuvA [Campylobacterota bacterium]
MIVGLRGRVIKKEPTALHIDVGGVIYEVFISLNASAAIEDGELQIHTTHIVREDSQSLYGFVDRDEKKMFDRLIKLNGVGPKVAMAICSTFRPEEFVEAVRQKSVAKLKKVPGIGPKSAQRILVELGEFELGSAQPSSDAQIQAAKALESLGFKKDQIQKALGSCKATETSELVKEALKIIQKV